jgi:hypothetical protein
MFDMFWDISLSDVSITMNSTKAEYLVEMFIWAETHKFLPRLMHIEFVRKL